MRRGLMRWDAEELPLTSFEQRLARLREAMQRERVDALLIYTNLVRPSAVCWLTGFTPYWSEGALLVGRSGSPVFVTALSKRVAEWIRTTNPVSEITNAPQPGKLLGERLARDASVKRVGVLELDELPAGLADDFAAAAPAIEMVDAGAMFAALRSRTDAAERKLIAQADTIATAALNRIDAGAATDAGHVAGIVEQQARLAGAEEAYIAVAPDLDSGRRLNRITRPAPLGRRFAVRASVAYKGAWVRSTRSFARDEAERVLFARAEDWLSNLTRSLQSGQPLQQQIAAFTKTHPDVQVQSWMAESCIGSYPLQAIAGSNIAASLPLGDFAVLTVDASIDRLPWLGATPVLVPAER